MRALPGTPSWLTLAPRSGGCWRLLLPWRPCLPPAALLEAHLQLQKASRHDWTSLKSGSSAEFARSIRPQCHARLSRGEALSHFPTCERLCADALLSIV